MDGLPVAWPCRSPEGFDLRNTQRSSSHRLKLDVCMLDCLGFGVLDWRTILILVAARPFGNPVSQVETDSYFAAANFRRFVLGRNLTPEACLGKTAGGIRLGKLSFWSW